MAICRWEQWGKGRNGGAESGVEFILPGREGGTGERAECKERGAKVARNRRAKFRLAPCGGRSQHLQGVINC